MTLAVAVEPDFGGAAPLDHEVDFLVQVSFRVKCAGPWYLDDVAAPFAFGAVQLDVAAFAAQPLPWRKWQILHLAHADVAVDRNALRFHEQVVGRLGSAALAASGRFVAARLMRMRPARPSIHHEAS